MTATYDADLQLFIDGAWRSGEGRERRPVHNPATAGTIAELPVATADDLDEALAAAARGWPVWRAKTPDERAALMRRMRDRSGSCGPPKALRSLLRGSRLFDYDAEIRMAIEQGGDLPVLEIVPDDRATR